MAAEGKKGDSRKQITEKERYNYIGFDVFPGTPKDLFKSDAEKSKYVDAIKAKRDTGDVVRDECKLLEERVSSFDRIVLTIACVIVFGTFTFPWFTAYNEVVEESNELDPISAVVDSAVVTDSALMAMSDSTNVVTHNLDSTVLAATNDGTPLESEQAIVDSDPFSDEVIHGFVAKKKIRKEYATLAGYNVLLSLGSLGGYVFGSGIILMLSGILFILFLLACLALPAYTLYGLYGLKGDADKQALSLKKILKYNWIPVILFFIVFILSFFGAEYGFDSQALFTSLGTSYGPNVFMGTMSFGVIVSLGAFILNALKGVEI